MAQQEHMSPTFVRRRRGVVITIFAGLLASFSLLLNTRAQALSSIVSDGTLPTPTAVTQMNNVYNINGGTIRGGNQFHSFDVFSVGTGDIASFNGPIGIVNILGRVTGLQSGLQQSLIDGTIQTTIFGANLFLMNPAGIVFGPNASLNVSGSVAFTTANYLRLGDDVRFNALPGANDMLLSAAPITAFGFLNENPASVTVLGSQLRVPITTDPETGQPVDHTLSLIGGDITIAADPTTSTPSTLSAPSGHINLGSMASSGEVHYPSLQSGTNITMGTVRLQEFSALDVSDSLFEGDGHAGTVRIRSGQFVMDSAFIIADTVGSVSGNEVGVSIITKGDVSLTNSSLIFTEAFGAGRSGDIEVSARNMTVKDGSFLQTITTDTGEGGNIKVAASNSVLISGTDGFANPSNIQTLAFGTGKGGSVTIDAASLTVSGDGFIQTASFGTGNPGNVFTKAQNDLHIASGGRISSGGGLSSGDITIIADGAIITGRSDQGLSRIENKNGVEQTGNIEIAVRELSIMDEAAIITEGSGPSRSGNIWISATESIAVNDKAAIRMTTDAGRGGAVEISAPTITMDQGIIQTLTVRSGDAGAVDVVTNNLTLTGSQIKSQTDQGLGRGGDVTINATDHFSVAGQFAGSEIDAAGPAGIFTTTEGLAAEAGTVSVRARAVTLSDGARIDSNTFGAGNAGPINVAADTLLLSSGGRLSSSTAGKPGRALPTGSAGPITIEGLGGHAESIRIVGAGSGLFTETSGTGAGGNITTSSNQLRLENSATISAKTTGQMTGAGNAGNILVKADDITISGGATITAASAGKGNAGTVTIQGTNSPSQSLLITGAGSGLFSNTSGTGAGGDILVVADEVELANGGTLSAKTTGTASTATGGTITVRGDDVRVESGATMTASSSGPGKAGNILIEGTASPAESIRIDDPGSGLFTETSGTGAGGDITAWSEQLRLTNGSTISAKTTGQMPNAGDGGNILIKADDITISGGATITAASTGTGNAGTVTIQGAHSPARSLLITGAGSGIFSDTSGTGSGGDLVVISESVRLADGGMLSAATSGTDASAVGGTIGILAEHVRIENGVITASSTGQGEGGSIGVLAAGMFESHAGTISTAASRADAGDIGIFAGQSATLNNGTSISTRSTGPGHAGDIFIDAGQRFEMHDSAVTAEAAQAAGGSIDIRALDRVKLVGSLISTSVLGGAGSGGNIFIDPNLTTLQASQILAQAVLGNGGNITLVTSLFFADPFSRIDASSQFGLNGLVQIQSPTSNLAGTLGTLPSSLRQTPNLQTGRCAALANSQSSSFLIAGRDAIPNEPGGWQPSPFALSGDGSGLAARDDGHLKAAPLMAMAEGTVSLRRLTPAGFLTHSFAESGSTGCRA